MAKGTVAHRNRLRMAWELAKITFLSNKVMPDKASGKDAFAKPSVPLIYLASAFEKEMSLGLPANALQPKAQPDAGLYTEVLGAAEDKFTPPPSAGVTGRTWVVDNNKGAGADFATIFAMRQKLSKAVLHAGDRILFKASETPYTNVNNDGTYGSHYIQMPKVSGHAKWVTYRSAVDTTPRPPQGYRSWNQLPSELPERLPNPSPRTPRGRLPPQTQSDGGWYRNQPVPIIFPASISDPVIIEAEAGAVIHLIGGPLNISAGADQDQGTDSTAVPLILRNLRIVGHPADAGSDLRARQLINIRRCLDVTMEDCSFTGSENILNATNQMPDLVHYGPGDFDNAVTVNGAIAGSIKRCVFDTVTNIDEFDAPNKRWDFLGARSGPDGLELANCTNMLIDQCFFGNAFHGALSLRGVVGIVLRRSFFRNRVHSAMFFQLPLGKACIIEHCVFAGVGQRSVAGPLNALPEAVMLGVGGANHIIAFNVFCADPEADDYMSEPNPLKPVGFYGDRGINFAGAQHDPCTGSKLRCVDLNLWNKFLSWSGPPGTAFDALQKQLWDDPLNVKPSNAVCDDGQPPSLATDCDSEGGLSKLGFWCRNEMPQQRKKICAKDLAEPNCPTGLSRVCVATSWSGSMSDLLGKPSLVNRAGDDFSQPGGLLYGESDANHGHVVLNNLFLDLGKYAISLDQSDTFAKAAHFAATTEPGVRNVLVMNNVILGQRRDPTVNLLQAFYENYNNGGAVDKDGHIYAVQDAKGDWLYKLQDAKGNSTYVRKSTPGAISVNTELLVPSGTPSEGFANPDTALVDITVAGQREGFAGNLFVFNVIGRRDEDPVYLSSPPMVKGWHNPAVNDEVACSATNKCGISDLLSKMLPGVHGFQAEWGYVTTATGWNSWNDKDKVVSNIKGKFVGPPWLQIQPKGGWNLVGPTPFATDWAVRLPQSFTSSSLGYQWGSVADLNDPKQAFGQSNLTIRGLYTVGPSDFWSGVAGSVPAWPSPAFVPAFVMNAVGFPWDVPEWYPNWATMPTANGAMPLSDSNAKGQPAQLEQKLAIAAKWPHALAYVEHSRDMLGTELASIATFRGPFQP